MKGHMKQVSAFFLISSNCKLLDSKDSQVKGQWATEGRFLIVGSGLSEAQVSLPRRQVLCGDTFGKESLGLFVWERGNDHDLLTRLKQTREQESGLNRQALDLINVKKASSVMPYYDPVMCGSCLFVCSAFNKKVKYMKMSLEVQ